MSSDCLVFALYLNQMSHPKMFPTINLMTKRTRNQTKFWYIFLPYGHVLFPLCVSLRLFSLLIFRNLLLLIHTSVYFRLFLWFFWFFLCYHNFFFVSPIFFLTLNISISFLSPPHCIIMTQCVFQYLLSLFYHAKSSRILWMIFFVRVRLKSQFKIGFFKSSSVEDLFKQRTW